MSRKDNWSYGVIEEDKSKLQSLLNMLRRPPCSTVGGCCH
jgi:hypothetical protein